MTSIHKYLLEHGPSLTSEVAAFLVKEERLSPEAARKRISRLPSDICRLSACFPRREVLLYLRPQWKSPEYFDRLKAALRATGSAPGRAIQGIEARGGIVAQSNFPVASGLPVKPIKKQLSHAVVEQRLLELEIIDILQTRDGPVVTMDSSENSVRRWQAVALAESLVIQTLRTSLVKLGVVSSKKTAVRGDASQPVFGPFAWDLVGPSYLSGLSSRTPSGPTTSFVVADVALDREITNEDLVSFIHKCDTILNQKRHRRFLAIFVADYFENAALMELRKRGCVIGTTSNLFGKTVAAQIRDLIGTLQNAAAAVVNDPDKLFSLLEKLNRIEGASLNLRGVVLEFMAAHFYSVTGYKIDIRQKILAPNGKEAEIDVKATRADEVVCIECKAKVPGNLTEISEIQDWVDDKLPRIKSWLSNYPSLPLKKRFEFWVSGALTPEASAYVDEIAEKHKKQPIAFIVGKQILMRFREMNLISLVRIFEEQFGAK